MNTDGAAAAAAAAAAADLPTDEVLQDLWILARGVSDPAWTVCNTAADTACLYACIVARALDLLEQGGLLPSRGGDRTAPPLPTDEAALAAVALLRRHLTACRAAIDTQEAARRGPPRAVAPQAAGRATRRRAPCGWQRVSG